METFWSNFISNFSANILSDILLAIAIFFIVTQPGEKRKRNDAIKKSLGLLKAEAQVNLKRAEAYSKSLIKSDEKIVALFPLRYSRGAWNALKETDFFSNLQDAHLIYYLFRMNEATFVANRNLRKLQLAYLNEKEDNLQLLIETTRKESKLVVEVLSNALRMLQDVQVPSFAIEDPFDAEMPPMKNKSGKRRRKKNDIDE